MKYRISLIFLIASLFSIELYSQTVSEYPVSFLSTSFNTFIQSSEIRNVDSTKINVSSFIRKNTGIFSDVYQSKTQMGINLNHSTISLQFYNDHQGDLIKRNRLYMNYNAHISITRNTQGFAGLSAGMVNKSLGNQNTNVQGTASVFDASAIVGAYGRNWFASFSANQIPQNTITPINFDVPLLRYYQFYSSISCKITSDLMLEGMFMDNFYSTQSTEYIGGVQLKWKRDYNFGVEISNYNIANYFIDFKIKDFSHSSILLLVSYETNHNLQSHYNTSFSIFNVGFVIKVKK